MTSFQITITPSRRAAARFISAVRRSMQRSFADENANSGLTQSKIARELGVHRSVISRELRGYKDMTLGRIGELAWALGKEPYFTLIERRQTAGENLPASSSVMDMCSISNVVSASGSTLDLNERLGQAMAA